MNHGSKFFATEVHAVGGTFTTVVDEYKDRLADAMKAAGVSTTDLSRSLGISYQAVRKVLLGGQFGTDNNAAAAHRLGVNSDWLATGKGPRHSDAAAKAGYVRTAPPATAEPPAAYGMEPILAWEHADDLPEGEFVMVPRLDVHLSAGNGHSNQVEIDLIKENPQAFRAEWIRLMRLKPAKLAAMRASGESMEPTIYDGDSLLVDTSQADVIDGKVYALWYDGGERVKRLFRLPGGGLRIKSDNPAHGTIEMGPDYAGHVRVIGRVVHRSSTGGL